MRIYKPFIAIILIIGSYKIFITFFEKQFTNYAMAIFHRKCQHCFPTVKCIPLMTVNRSIQNSIICSIFGMWLFLKFLKTEVYVEMCISNRVKSYTDGRWSKNTVSIIIVKTCRSIKNINLSLSRKNRVRNSTWITIRARDRYEHCVYRFPYGSVS